jgi:hypothetical protein
MVPSQAVGIVFLVTSNSCFNTHNSLWWYTLVSGFRGPCEFKPDQSRPYGTLIVPASTGPPLNGSAGDQSTSNRSARSQDNGTARITQLPSAPYLFSRARVPLRCPAMSLRLQSSTCNVLDSPTKRKGRQHVRPAVKTSQSFLANLACCTHSECTAYCTTHGATA